VKNFLAILEADGISVVDDHLEAWLSDPERLFAEKFFNENNLDENNRTIAIHPFSANQKRAWHEDNFIEVANYLQEKYGVRVIVLGGKRDIPLSDYFTENINPDPVTVVGKTSLRETMAILSRCSLLLCNDSGIMHLGAALNLPLIALFGPQSPVKFGPWGENCEIIYKNFPCSPCKQKFFEECEPSERMKPHCMEHITVGDVIDIVEKKFTHAVKT
jgi:heptosyltransferase-2